MPANEREEPQDLDTVLSLLTEPITENDYALASVGFDPILAALLPDFESVDFEAITDEISVIFDAAENRHIRALTLFGLSDAVLAKNDPDYLMLEVPDEDPGSDDESFDPDASLAKIEEVLRANKKHLSQDTIDKLDL